MKLYTKILFILILAIFPARALIAQIEFVEIKTEKDWEQIIEKAENEKKLIFLDIYASWCGPCKMLERDIYPDPDLGEYYNAEFVNLKMDGETDFGRKKAMEFALRAYPSMYYLSAKGRLIASVVGVRQADELQDFGKKVVENSDKLLDLEESFAAKSLTAHELMEYHNLLAEFGAETKAGQVSKEILLSLSEDDILNPDYKEIVINSRTELDDIVFQTFRKNQVGFDSIYTQEEKELLLSNIFDESLGKAILSNSEEYRDRIINEFLPLYFESTPERVEYGGFMVLKIFYSNTGNWEAFEMAILERYENSFSGDDKFLYSESYDIVNNYNSSPEAMATAGKLMDKAVLMNPSFDNLVLVAYLAGIGENYEKAKSSLAKVESMELDEQQKSIVEELKKIISQVEDEE